MHMFGSTEDTVELTTPINRKVAVVLVLSIHGFGCHICLHVLEFRLCVTITKDVQIDNRSQNVPPSSQNASGHFVTLAIIIQTSQTSYISFNRNMADSEYISYQGEHTGTAEPQMSGTVLTDGSTQVVFETATLKSTGINRMSLIERSQTFPANASLEGSEDPLIK